MATKFNAGEVGRQDIYTFFPENLVVDQKENSRVVPHSEEEVHSLAKSILEHGQQQAAVGRKIEDNKVQLVAGYGRLAAFKYINTVLQPDKPMKIAVRVVTLNNEEAFVRSIVENIDRAETTPIDDAHAQRRLKEDFGWTDARIAEFYKSSVAYIGQLRKTLSLSKEIQQEVVKGNLPVSTAITLTELPETERKDALTQATNPETGKVNTETVNKIVRNRKITTGTGAKARSLKEVRTFFEELTGPAEPQAIRELSKKFLQFVNGKITEETMTKNYKKWTLKEDATTEATPQATETGPDINLSLETPAAA